MVKELKVLSFKYRRRHIDYKYKNFFFLSFKEQTDHSANDYEKVASDSIVKIPLQTVHKPENIWNSNADNKQDSLSTRDFSSHGFVEDKE